MGLGFLSLRRLYTHHICSIEPRKIAISFPALQPGKDNASYSPYGITLTLHLGLACSQMFFELSKTRHTFTFDQMLAESRAELQNVASQFAEGLRYLLVHESAKKLRY